MGLALEQLKFETTDSSWAAVPLQLIAGPTYKSLTIKNVSLYLNPDPRADEIAKDKQNKDEAADQGERQEPALPASRGAAVTGDRRCGDGGHVAAWPARA